MYALKFELFTVWKPIKWISFAKNIFYFILFENANQNMLAKREEIWIPVSGVLYIYVSVLLCFQQYIQMALNACGLLRISNEVGFIGSIF